MKPYAVVFAGVPGSSKTIIANYLSGIFGLPVFNNDQLRHEVKEDLMLDDINIPEALAEFEKRLKARYLAFLGTGRPIIFDSGVDRRWAETKQLLQDAGYSWYLINMELTKPFLAKLFKATGRAGLATDYLDKYTAQHEAFIKKYAADVNLQISDDAFKNRLALAEDGLRKFIGSLEK